MNDPHVWWYVTRASAMIAWVLMTVAVVWGILLSTRIFRRVDNPAWLTDLHRYLGGVSVIMVLLHMASLALDGWIHMSLVELLTPFATAFKPFPVALGILAFYLLIAVQGTSLVMHRLPRKFWKGLHYSSYASILLVSFHAGLVGTDVGSWWYRLVSTALIGIAAVAVVTRVLSRNKVRREDAVTIPAPDAKRMSPPPRNTKTMVVAQVSDVALGVRGIRLLPLGGGQLPPWYPGAHIALHLGNGLERQYSLCGDAADRTHFDVAVLRTDGPAGGSAWVHDNIRPGMTIEVSGPINHFELVPATDYLFIAGGIGITPIMGMIESLPQRRNWRLAYLGRSLDSMPFARELLERYPDRVFLHPSDRGLGRVDFRQLSVPEGTEVYCCGPEALMNAVSEVVPAERYHTERFVPVERTPKAADQSVRVTFRKSPLELTVLPGQSILDVLESNGLPVVGSCRMGVCGACEVGVVKGEPDHLDSVMSDEQKDKLGVMYPCVSRSRSEELVLDL